MTLGDNFKQMNIIHAALCIGCALILFIMYTLVNQDKNAVPATNMIFTVLGIAIAFINVLLSRILFFMRTQQAQTISDFGQKINKMEKKNLSRVCWSFSIVCVCVCVCVCVLLVY